MSRGVQDVDAEAVVLELHDGGSDGDAPLLLNLHPVAGSGPGPLALDLAGLGDGPAVEQELFREGGFARVGMGDDGEGSPPGDLVLESGHVIASWFFIMRVFPQI